MPPVYEAGAQLILLLLLVLRLTRSGGGGAASILGLAALAVDQGAAECVVAFRSRNRSKSTGF